MFTSALGRFRLIGYLEGLSFLILLGIAMPLKYVFDIPEPVTIIGGLHGFLFALYLIAIAVMTFLYRWRTLRSAAAIISAFVPFGPFIFERNIRDK
jgi:integral membrane protein